MNMSLKYIDNPSPGFKKWNLKLRLKSGVTWWVDFDTLEEAFDFVNKNY